jgi:hypothetical protein
MAMIPLSEFKRRNRIKLSRQRLDKLAKQGRIPGAKFKFRRWEVPESAPVLIFNPGRPSKGEKPFPRVNR